MKKLTLCFAALLAFYSASYAQYTACSGVTAPAVNSGMSATEVGGGIPTTAPTMMTNAVGLTHVEFAITKKGTAALDDNGSIDTMGQRFTSVTDVILGSDDGDGIFLADYITRYGITLAPGDTIEVTAVGYNLSQLRTLVQKLLTGTTGGGASCCAAISATLPDAAGFCDTLRGLGITDSNSVHGLGELLAVFDAFSARQLSMRNLVANIVQINSFSTTFPNNCGGTSTSGGGNGGPMICYGVDLNARYGYRMNNQVAVERLSPVTSFVMLPNPANQGRVTLLLDVKAQSDLSVRIHNQLGQVVFAKNLGQVSGMISENISTSEFTTGVYFVEITDGQNRETRKLLVNN